MKNMDESITHPDSQAANWAASEWKTFAATLAALLLAALFIVAGVWKITDPFSAAQRMAQARVPANLSLLAACMFGVAETYSGVLLVVPRFRRWGAWLSGVLLIAFLIYIGYYYGELHGEECNCFPWVKRAVGPAFFIGDAIMLVLAALAAWWSRPSAGLRSALLILMAVGVFAAVSFGVSARMQGRVAAPAQIEVNGSPVSLHEGRFLLYFFDPECTHCLQAARDMARLQWRDVRVIGVPTEQPQFGPDFMQTTGLNAPLTSDVAALRKVFKFTDSPYAVALENGHSRVVLADFDPARMSEKLRSIDFIR